MICLDMGTGGGGGAARVAEPPVVDEVEEEEEEGNEAEGLGRVKQSAAAVGPVAGGESDGNNPEVGEDEVEQQAVVDGEEEGGEVEDDGQDRDCEDVDDVRALAVVEGDEVGEDAHDNDGRDPDESIEGRSDGIHALGARSTAVVVGGVGTHCGLMVWLLVNGVWCKCFGCSCVRTDAAVGLWLR